MIEIKPIHDINCLINKFCWTVGLMPTSYKTALTIEEQILALGCYLENEIYPAINQNADAVVELQNLYINLKNYVDNYFNNLDVQTEINTKLDEMAQSGELQEIISSYLQAKGVLSFNTVQDMINSSLLVEGSTIRTLGQNLYNDGYGRFYKIEHIVSANENEVDGINLINLNRDDLYARLIKEQFLFDIGDITQLKTPNKSSLVKAINSILPQIIAGDNSLPDGTTFHVLAGTIRQDETDPTQWHWINDTNHSPIGFGDNITIDSSNYYINIPYDQHYDKVISLIATPDNYLASNAELSIGASVGLDNALISLGTSHEYTGQIYFDGTNWIDSNGGTVNFNNGILTLTPNPNNILYLPYSIKCETISRGYNTVKQACYLIGGGIRFIFVNNDGTRAISPSEDMALQYTIGGSRSVRVNQNLGLSSNIWILGIMAKFPVT